jgi:cell division protein FtsI/penicillin-binding protein 2
VAFAKRVAAARPDEFVDAVTLRQQDYLAASSQLELPGIVARDGTRSLAPTAQFARGVIGTVGPATEETLSEAGPTASAVDLVGLSGLQRVYQRQLAGTPGFSVVLVDQATEQPVGGRLFSQEPTPGQPVRTTLDTTVQNAADNALAAVTKPTSLVAVDTATGGVLAASNAPNAGDNRAFTGRYPPGSTFKILSAAALVSAGVSPETPVTCPATTTVGGKRFKNFEFTSFESGDLALAFARSCNTVFVSLADRLAAGALTEEAGLFGLGAEWDIGVPSFSGSVPEPTDAVDEAAAMIGQSRVLASPLAMAEVAAAVASGQPRAAMLVDPSPTPPRALAPLAPELTDSLRAMMRETVTEGTGSALAGLGEVHAKTGTAEYGTDVPPGTHAWLVGYRGDVAFAVIVEDGASGAEDAAPVVTAFLSALPA